ncbi:MAG: class II aldolase/adducin family protein [Ignavibacteria bacterium]|nr:class II aldolase/adducin family protein [Ignavibacteria bacterium]MDP3831246.1 class II aldolase/adducin family protein [Ignavibacteriaceae bacterium]
MSLKKELVEICHKVYSKGFVAAYDGNLSLRTPDNTVLITRSGVCKGDVNEKDIVEIDYDGNLISGSAKISTENKIHLFLYQNRNDVNAVIHCHPVYTTAIATSRNILDQPVFPEVVLTIGRIPLCEYATPSTDGLIESMKPFVDFASVFLLQNHGVVAAGKNITQAYFFMEKLEHTAKILINAELLGGTNKIPAEKLLELYSIAEKTYGLQIRDANKFIE